MRKRNKTITFRMSDREYERFMERVNASGQTIQSYIINSALGAKLSTKEELKEIKMLSEILKDNNKQLRGMATNINQLTRKANQTGDLPSEKVLDDTLNEVKNFQRKEAGTWQLIRQLIHQQAPTEQCATASNTP